MYFFLTAIDDLSELDLSDLDDLDLGDLYDLGLGDLTDPNSKEEGKVVVSICIISLAFIDEFPIHFMTFTYFLLTDQFMSETNV